MMNCNFCKKTSEKLFYNYNPGSGVSNYLCADCVVTDFQSKVLNPPKKKPPAGKKDGIHNGQIRKDYVGGNV